MTGPVAPDGLHRRVRSQMRRFRFTVSCRQADPGWRWSRPAEWCFTAPAPAASARA